MEDDSGWFLPHASIRVEWGRLNAHRWIRASDGRNENGQIHLSPRCRTGCSRETEMNLPAHTPPSMWQPACGRRTTLHCLAFITLAFAVSFAFGCRQRVPPPDFSGSVSTNQPLLVLKGHTRWVNRVVFSPNGTRLASAGGDGDATVKIWDSKTGELLRTLAGHDRGVYNVAFSPDGKMIASAGHDHTLVLWN